MLLLCLLIHQSKTKGNATKPIALFRPKEPVAAAALEVLEPVDAPPAAVEAPGMEEPADDPEPADMLMPEHSVIWPDVAASWVRFDSCRTQEGG